MYKIKIYKKTNKINSDKILQKILQKIIIL